MGEIQQNKVNHTVNRSMYSILHSTVHITLRRITFAKFFKAFLQIKSSDR